MSGDFYGSVISLMIDRAGLVRFVGWGNVWFSWILRQRVIFLNLCWKEGANQLQTYLNLDCTAWLRYNWVRAFSTFSERLKVPSQISSQSCSLLMANLLIMVYFL